MATKKKKPPRKPAVKKRPVTITLSTFVPEEMNLKVLKKNMRDLLSSWVAEKTLDCRPQVVEVEFPCEAYITWGQYTDAKQPDVRVFDTAAERREFLEGVAEMELYEGYEVYKTREEAADAWVALKAEQEALDEEDTP